MSMGACIGRWRLLSIAPPLDPRKGKLSGSVTPAIRSNFGETCSSASKLALVEPCGRVGAAAGLLRGLRGGARGGAEVPATRGPIWRSVRCAATAWDPTPPRRSPSWHGPRHCGRRSQHSHLWPRRPSLRDDDRPGGFSDPAAARVVAAARPGRSGGLPGPLRRERGEWTSPRVDAIHGVNDDSNPPDVAGAGKGST
jgi:hypothetical protein